jgi:hypothetical protein
MGVSFSQSALGRFVGDIQVRRDQISEANKATVKKLTRVTLPQMKELEKFIGQTTIKLLVNPSLSTNNWGQRVSSHDTKLSGLGG